MALSLSDYTGPIAVGSAVHDIVPDWVESGKAAGYAAFIQAITGRVPYVVRIPNTSRVRIVMDQAQIKAVQQWLDAQVAGAFKAGPPAPVEYELGPALGPWALKYGAPSLAGVLIIGAIGGYLLKSFWR